jgi:hypothetical protein
LLLGSSSDLDADKPNIAKGYFVKCAIDDAAFLLEPIDEL